MPRLPFPDLLLIHSLKGAQRGVYMKRSSSYHVKACHVRSLCSALGLEKRNGLENKSPRRCGCRARYHYVPENKDRWDTILAYQRSLYFRTEGFAVRSKGGSAGEKTGMKKKQNGHCLETAVATEGQEEGALLFTYDNTEIKKTKLGSYDGLETKRQLRHAAIRCFQALPSNAETPMADGTTRAATSETLEY